MSSLFKETLYPVKKTGTLQGYDGVNLFYECFRNPRARGVIAISHGFCEFSEKYEEVIYNFFMEGFTVYIMDHRGHGNSVREIQEPGKVYIHNYSEYVLDFKKLTQLIQSEIDDLPLFLFGHSMGGTIGMLYLEHFDKDYKAAIFSSPMLKFNKGRVPEWVNYLIVAINIFRGKKFEYIPDHDGFDSKSNFQDSSCTSESRYKYIFQKRLNNINYQTNGATYGWAFASLKAVKETLKNINKLKTPVLICQATNDSVVNNKGQDIASKKTSLIKLVRFENTKHEIYNSDEETIKKYYKEIIDFLD